MDTDYAGGEAERNVIIVQSQNRQCKCTSGVDERASHSLGFESAR